MSSHRWSDRLLGAAGCLLVAAVMIHAAAHLILTVLPVLIGAAGVAATAWVGWAIYQWRRSRW